ncbi:Geminin/Multicilin [Trinorchestia longiramus]|nr:Geminin/Multicilin [Trinorchestia longiramus]
MFGMNVMAWNGGDLEKLEGIEGRYKGPSQMLALDLSLSLSLLLDLLMSAEEPWIYLSLGFNKMVERNQAGILRPTRQAKLAIHNSNIVLNSPIARKRKNEENLDPTKPISRHSIYEDPPTPASKRTKLSSKVDCAVQTDLPLCATCTPASSSTKDLPGTQTPDGTQAAAASVQSEKPKSKQSAQDVLDMLISDKPSEQYWEMVAAERKVALLASLAENKQLHEGNSQLQKQVHSMGSRIDLLKKDNAMLEEMLAEAKQLAELVEAATKGDSEFQEDGEEAEFSQLPTSPQHSSQNPETCESNNSVS